LKLEVKIYGERNSGTNYLEKILAANFMVSFLKYYPNVMENSILRLVPYDFVQDIVHLKKQNKTLGWKHGCPPIKSINRNIKAETRFICISKNPYAFLFSLYKRPYHMKGKKKDNFSSFLRSEWGLRRRDLLGEKRVKNPVLLWNRKYDSYVKLSEQYASQVAIVRYEDLIFNGEDTLALLKEKLGLEAINENFKLVKSSGVEEHKSLEFYKNFYQNEEWKTNFSEEDINFVNEQLDQDLVALLNYNLLN
jgi:hypothetical protein